MGPIGDMEDVHGNLLKNLLTNGKRRQATVVHELPMFKLAGVKVKDITEGTTGKEDGRCEQSKQMQQRKRPLLKDELRQIAPVLQREDEYYERMCGERILNGFSRRNKHSNVYNRVGKSNQRLKRMVWGHSLAGVVREEQYKPARSSDHRRPPVPFGNQIGLSDSEADRLKRKQNLLYGAKVALEHVESGKFLGARKQQEGCMLTETGTKFIIVNLDDPQSTLPIQFGERIGLCMINCSKVVGVKHASGRKRFRVQTLPNDEKALLTAKWRLLNPNNLDEVHSKSSSSNNVLTDMDIVAFEYQGHMLTCTDREQLIADPAIGYTPETSNGASKSSQGPEDDIDIPIHFVERSARWKVHLFSNANTKKVPRAQKVLMRAQNQLSRVKELENGRKTFPAKVSEQMEAFEDLRNNQYLLHDPTNKNLGEAAIRRYFTMRLQEQTSAGTTGSSSQRHVHDQTHSPEDRYKKFEQNEQYEFMNNLLAKERNRRLDAMKNLQMAKVRAITASQELKVPTLVWQHIHEQETIIQRKLRLRRTIAAMVIQKAFRNWKRYQWIRNFKGIDVDTIGRVESERRAAKPGEVKSKPKIKRTISAKYLHLAKMKTLNRSTSETSSSRTSTSRKASTSHDSSILSSVKDPEEFNEDIQRHFHVLRHSNPTLFKDIPVKLLEPDVPFPSNKKPPQSTIQDKPEQINTKTTIQAKTKTRTKTKTYRCLVGKSKSTRMVRPHSAAHLRMNEDAQSILSSDGGSLKTLRRPKSAVFFKSI